VRELLNWRSLRWRIAALAAVVSCAMALVIGVLVHRSTFERSMSVGGDRALTALWEPSSFASPAEEIPLPLLERVRSTGRAATWYDERRPDIPWMWAAEIVGGRVHTVKIDMGADLLSRRALDRHIVLASLAALAVVVPLAALLAELPGRRLRRVAGTARRIAGGELDARTAAGGPRGDEITEISATVDSMADSLQSLLRNEQRFTADVAHELRTPLMGLVTSAELLPESEATDLVRGRVRVLRDLVEDLLEISRLDAGEERAEARAVPVGDAVEASLARTGLPARLAVTGDAVAQTDPRRLDRIITNLVVNAHRHGRTPVEVTVDGTAITVRDHGPGFPGDLLADGPQRFRTGAAERGRGHGLGLTIAAGQARVLGATLTFANATDGGAVATLRLP
jgi:signal transduction histidine kinase